MINLSSFYLLYKYKQKNKCDYVFSWPINICKSHGADENGVVVNALIDCERLSSTSEDFEDNDGRLCKTINLNKTIKFLKRLQSFILSTYHYQ